MEEPKYYDIITKQEIDKQELKPEVPYLVLKEKWKIRMVTFQKSGEEKETLLTLQEEEKARQEILKQRLIQMGYQVEKIQTESSFIVNGVQINEKVYKADLQDTNHRTGSFLFDTTSLQSMIQNTAEGKKIELQDIRLGANQNLIEAIGSPYTTNLAQNMAGGRTSAKSSIVLNINQWGFQRSYRLDKKEDVQRLIEEQKEIPRNQKQAMEKEEGRNQN